MVSAVPSFHITAIGELLIDFTPAGFSQRGDMLFARIAGGAPANGLAAASNRGCRTAFIGKVGQDSFCRFLKDTLEAARMDGLNEYQIFFKIFMPMMKSTYAAAGIFMFMASWNNYMWPLIALQSDTKFTLPLVVANLASGFTPDYGMTMVGIVLSTLPTIIVFFTLQKSFVEGMTGSVK